jgi:hypothetical protein
MDFVFKNVLVLVNVFSLPTACPFLDHGRDSESDSGGFKRKATEWLRKNLYILISVKSWIRIRITVEI